MSSVSLTVNGQEYAGWQGVRITRGIEAIAGAFDLSVSDRWNGQFSPWPIAEEDQCVLRIDGAKVLTGYVDRRSISFDKQAHTLNVSGRDRAGELVDCSALLSKWEYIGINVLALVRTVAKPYGISVSLQQGLKVPTSADRFTVDPGETAFEVIDRACRLTGILPVSDGLGGLLLTRAGSSRASTSLVEGKNILHASADYDASGRYASYKLMAQCKGADSFYGAAAAQVTARATDAGVRRSERTLLIRPEGGINPTYAQQRVQWEASVRAARGDAIGVTVQGWQQPDGTLWPVNALIPLHSPTLGVNGTFLISQAVHSLDDSGTLTELTLRRPDAFKPEPVVPLTLWKELANGATQ